MSSTLEMTCQVLLVDDDPHLRQALRQTLDLAGFQVSTRADAQGLAAQLPSDWPGVVVSDIRMPGLDAPSAVRWPSPGRCRRAGPTCDPSWR